MSNTFKNSVVYRISCKDNSTIESYIGSTINLHRRTLEHRKNCSNPNSREYYSPLYCVIRANSGWDNWKIETICRVFCQSKEQLISVEREYIEAGVNLINQKIPGRTPKEYYADNRDRILKQKKEYYSENIDGIREKKHDYYVENKILIDKKTTDYYQEHRDKICKMKRDLYAKANDCLPQYKAFFELEHGSTSSSRKVTCCCGKTMRFDCLGVHRGSKKHQNYIKMLS